MIPTMRECLLYCFWPCEDQDETVNETERNPNHPSCSCRPGNVPPVHDDVATSGRELFNPPWRGPDRHTVCPNLGQSPERPKQLPEPDQCADIQVAKVVRGSRWDSSPGPQLDAGRLVSALNTDLTHSRDGVQGQLSVLLENNTPRPISASCPHVLLLHLIDSLIILLSFSPPLSPGSRFYLPTLEINRRGNYFPWSLEMVLIC
uniref:Uncharacterized protein n=1 Tax=Timema monikensis TaxID=170555 RepID=A0A7R9EKZ5_9NEOP|nr:unnamed protein product [Timema monikensis]